MPKAPDNRAQGGNDIMRGEVLSTIVPPDGFGGGAIFFDFSANTQTIEELYANPQRMVEGSTIQVQEVISIELFVTQPWLVNVDLTWYGGKKYLGTWRLNNDDIVVQGGDGEEGFITSERYSIVRYSTYNIVPPRNRQNALYGGASIDNCNFAVVSELLKPGTLVPNASRLAPENPIQLFTSDHSIDYPLLGSQEFFPRINSVGLYIPPGIAVSSCTYRRRVVNEVELLRPPIPVPIACLYPADTCTPLYNALVTENDIFAPFSSIENLNNYYVAAGGDIGDFPIVEQEFVCPDGSIRYFYQFDAAIG